MDQKSIPMWRRLIVGKEKSWVVFAHGTCVVVANGAGQPADCAIQVMKEYGPVYAACPAADFTTLHLDPDKTLKRFDDRIHRLTGFHLDELTPLPYAQHVKVPTLQASNAHPPTQQQHGSAA